MSPQRDLRIDWNRIVLQRPFTGEDERDLPGSLAGGLLGDGRRHRKALPSAFLEHWGGHRQCGAGRVRAADVVEQGSKGGTGGILSIARHYDIGHNAGFIGAKFRLTVRVDDPVSLLFDHAFRVGHTAARSTCALVNGHAPSSYD